MRLSGGTTTLCTIGVGVILRTLMGLIFSEGFMLGGLDGPPMPWRPLAWLILSARPLGGPAGLMSGGINVLEGLDGMTLFWERCERTLGALTDFA